MLQQIPSVSAPCLNAMIRNKIIYLVIVSFWRCKMDSLIAERLSEHRLGLQLILIADEFLCA